MLPEQKSLVGSVLYQFFDEIYCVRESDAHNIMIHVDVPLSVNLKREAQFNQDLIPHLDSNWQLFAQTSMTKKITNLLLLSLSTAHYFYHYFHSSLNMFSTKWLSTFF